MSRHNTSVSEYLRYMKQQLLVDITLYNLHSNQSLFIKLQQF